MPTRSPYKGTERKLLLAFDVGTTFSGISYTFLDPGREPEIKPVTRFPGQIIVGGNAKISTVIYYGPDGIPRALGAETEREETQILAEESEWVKAEWFKLHLRPKTRATASISEDIPPLPPGKSAVDLFADFLRYLNQCARTYIEETHVDGASLLASGKVEYVLSHPNSWEGAQQTLMRRAAVQAGLVASTPEDQARVSFVTEGEACLNFCIDKGLMNESIKGGHGVTIVDAGGGTIDISTYAQSRSSNSEYSEIAAPCSHFKGSIFVTRAAARHLDGLLQGSRFHDDVTSMTDKFDKATKLGFRDPADPQYIRFGSVRDKDPDLGIKAGKLRLDGQVIAGFFEPSIQCIFDAVREQRKAAAREVSTVFLVGGFAASDYLFTQLQERLQKHGFSVHRPDAHLNKAVPDGAIVGSLRPTVRTRVAKFTYGVRSRLLFDPSKGEHVKRAPSCVTLTSGERRLPGGFWSLLPKNTQVTDTQEFRSPFFQEARTKRGLNRFNTTTITCYRGRSCPDFVDQDPQNFHDVFKIRADLSGIIDPIRRPTGQNKGIQFFRLDYEIIIVFGTTEFKAQYAWKEDGVEKRGPAEILFDTEIEYNI